MGASRKLVDLHPTWFGSGGAGITRDGKPVPEREGIGLMCDCPCGAEHRLAVPFRNPLDGQPADPYYATAWQRTGETFETLTLTPSILRSVGKGGCGWHGFLTDGVMVPC